EHKTDEFVSFAVLERRIESPLESDRRAWLAAQPLATGGTAEVRRKDFQMIREGQQPVVQAVIELLREPPFHAAPEEIRPPDAAREQRVAGQDEPRLGGAGAVGHEKRDAIRRVPGRGKNLQSNVAEIELVFVGQASMRKAETGGLV